MMVVLSMGLSNRILIHITLYVMLLVNTVYAAEIVSEDMGQVERWNQFARDLLTIAEHMKKGKVRIVESDGGYGGTTADLNFYHQIRTYDQASGKLLSDVKLENQPPKNLHIVEIYIYDQSGRLIRDYSAAYLPVHRRMPIQTLINFYAYSDNLDSFRQFDASDNLLYEHCRGSYDDEVVYLSLEYYEIPDDPLEIEDTRRREIYRACFDAMPKSVGVYINPLQELPLSSIESE
jgi:hypothetical protein